MPAFALVIFTLVVLSCKQRIKQDDVRDATPTSGVAYISVDETFKPIISQLIKVYESQNPKTHFIASYKSEAECFKDLDKDSVHMIITARKLTTKENAYYAGTLQYTMPSEVMAWDAVAVVVNNADTDTLFTKSSLKKYLASNNPADPQVIMDGSNATSTVRYLMDSIMEGTNFGTNVVAANGSKDVLNYISQHKNAIGFVGSGWIGSDQSDEQIAYLKYLKLGWLKCDICKQDTYLKPSQESIANMQYPLYRPLVAILKENSLGLAKGLFNFMMIDRG